jgi:isocitrate dehydrogenase
MIKKVEQYLKDHDTNGLDIRIMSPVDAMKVSLERIRAGKDTISVTGNVLRDYLTDLFPIMELGTSAKMLSIVPLMNGGGLFETGAGGSAPKHVQQLNEENFLRWDSLGEFLALAASLEHLGNNYNNPKALVLGQDPGPGHRPVPGQQQVAIAQGWRYRQPRQPLLPGAYWAQALAAQTEDTALQAQFATELAKTLTENEATIVAELNAVQGKPVDIGGYYFATPSWPARPCARASHLNDAINALKFKVVRNITNPGPVPGFLFGWNTFLLNTKPCRSWEVTTVANQRHSA